MELGGIEPGDVAVEVVYGRVSETDTLVEPSHVELTQVENVDGGKLRYVGEVPLDRPGAFGYSVRVVPSTSCSRRAPRWAWWPCLRPRPG